MKKFKNHQRPRRKYRFDIVGNKKALQIWWDSPFKIYIVNNFSVFYYRNLIRGYFVTNWQGKKVEKTTLKFFSNSAFSRFFQDFCHICYHNFIIIRDNWTIPTAMSSWDMRLNHKTLFENIFWNSAL